MSVKSCISFFLLCSPEVATDRLLMNVWSLPNAAANFVRVIRVIRRVSGDWYKDWLQIARVNHQRDHWIAVFVQLITSLCVQWGASQCRLPRGVESTNIVCLIFDRPTGFLSQVEKTFNRIIDLPWRNTRVSLQITVRIRRECSQLKRALPSVSHNSWKLHDVFVYTGEATIVEITRDTGQ